MSARFDPVEVKRRLPMVDLLTQERVQTRRAGPNFVANCPFHQERSDSFTVYIEADPAGDHAFCFGCGWKGDIFGFYQARRGVDFKTALAELASLVALSPSVRAATARPMLPRVTPRAKSVGEKPALPAMWNLSADMVTALARLRGLDPFAVGLVTRAKRLQFCRWPQYERGPSDWYEAPGATDCWVVTDDERRVAQFRRLDGLPFERKDGKAIKCWTKGSPTWPIGAENISTRGAVLLVEGGADMLAAFHFLLQFRQLPRVAVVAMLGASMRIAQEALPFFNRRHVRLMMDDDEAGINAAARWTEQLTAAGAAVESFTLGGLTRKDGLPVKDLNDLALVEESAWLDPELRAAFTDWDF